MKSLAAFLALLCCAVPMAAQQPAAVDPLAVAIEQEPRHHLVFTNEFVRILDVLLPPLYVSQNHTHTYDNVAITILPGVDGPQGPRPGFAGFSRGGYSHVITNPNTAPMRFIAVELRAGERGASGDAEPQANHLTVLNNARVRISRVTLDAGQVLVDHQHAAGYVSVVVRGGEGAGVWKWHPAGEASATLTAGRQPLEIVEVEPK